jgi:hypothetical protein
MISPQQRAPISAPETTGGHGILAGKFNGNVFNEVGYYELDRRMVLSRKGYDTTAEFYTIQGFNPTEVVKIDEASVILDDDMEGDGGCRLKTGLLRTLQMLQH